MHAAAEGDPGHPLHGPAPRPRVRGRVPPWARVGTVLVLLGAGLLCPTLRPHLLTALEEAWLAVGVFVAATFVVVFLVEARAGVDGASLLERHPRLEVPLAAALGALPGCGGAVVVVTRFAAGKASFGAMVAVLTATMGDAAFLVLARRPEVGLFLIVFGGVVGTLAGYLVNALHGQDFLRARRPQALPDHAPEARVPAWMWWAWALLLVPGLVLGTVGLFDQEVDTTLSLTFGLAGAVLSLVLWAMSPSQAATLVGAPGDVPLVERVARNTNFVTIWVVVGFLAYELAVGLGGWDLEAAFATVPALLPLMGVLVGFLPGCGPQIVVSTLYLTGVVPFSVQLGNAISNDGDALFPAIAAAPRAALVATLYTAIPALVAGYGWYLLVE